MAGDEPGRLDVVLLKHLEKSPNTYSPSEKPLNRGKYVFSLPHRTSLRTSGYVARRILSAVTPEPSCNRILEIIRISCSTMQGMEKSRDNERTS